MEYQQVVSRLAPCGLDCMRCAGCEFGEVRQLSCSVDYCRLFSIAIDNQLYLGLIFNLLDRFRVADATASLWARLRWPLHILI